MANVALHAVWGGGWKSLKNNKDVTHDIAELIRLHDDVLARVFALQTLLQDLGVLSPEQGPTASRTVKETVHTRSRNASGRRTKRI